MIFTGDIVFPNEYDFKVLNQLTKQFLKEPKIVNLESLINISHVILEKYKITKGIALYSSNGIINFLKALNVVGVSLANNHITDFDISINEQINYYLKDGIHAFGAGDNIRKAEKPFINEDFVILVYGWNVISCKYAREMIRGVNPLNYSHIFKQVHDFKEKYPLKKLIVLFHWNYEFELYPQPAHRKLSFDLIDAGVDAIFGHHSHIVQGFEVYKNKPIFYGLGNFYLPEQNYCGYNLQYPKEAKIGLAIKYNEDPDKCLCYWTKNDNNNLSIIKNEYAVASPELKKLTPYIGLTHKEYIKWFRANRKQRKLLPIYKNYNSHLNIFFDSFVLFRNEFINCMVNNGLK